jgi:hypothetical protein
LLLAAGFMGSHQLLASHAPRKLQLFDYSGVKLLDSRFRSQYHSARNLFRNIPNDNLLLRFRQRAGFPASGTPLVGCYGGRWTDPSHTSVRHSDIFNSFSQFISGVARMYRATNELRILEKTLYLGSVQESG